MGDAGDSNHAAIAAVRRGFELFNRGETETLFTETFDPQVSYRGDPQISALTGIPTDHEGVEGVQAAWEAFFEVFGTIQLTEIDLTLEDEQTVIGRCHMVAEGGTSGTPIDAPFHFAWVVRDRRWVFMAAKLNAEETLQALRDWQSAAGPGQSSHANE